MKSLSYISSISFFVFTSIQVLAQEDAMPFHGDVPVYSEEALQAGIDHQYDGPWES